MKKKNLIWAAGAISLLLLTSSMRQTPVATGAVQPQNTSLPFEVSQRGVQIEAKLYTETDSKNYLNYNLLRMGYTPIEITVRNHTANAYAISAASVPLACASSSDVAWSMTKKKLPGSVGLKIASFFFWPLMIPSTVEGIHTYKTHRSFTKDLEAKALKEKDEIIPPYATVTRILYVKKESFQETFSVALQEVDTKDLLVIHTAN